MDGRKRTELASLLQALPPVEFACIYGSSLHPNNSDKVSYFLLFLFSWAYVFLVVMYIVYMLSFFFWFSIQTSMIDYILGVADPQQWHAEVLVVVLYNIELSFIFSAFRWYTCGLATDWCYCPFSDQEPKDKSGSLCFVDGPWRSTSGVTLCLTSYSGFLVYFILIWNLFW